EDLPEGAFHRRGAIVGEQLHHAIDTESARGDLRIQIAAAFSRQAHVEEEKLKELGVELPPTIEPHDRDAQALLVDLRHATRHGAAGGATDISVVGEICDEGDQPPLDEYRNCHL